MSSAPDWLTRLADKTSYGQLSAIFREMVGEANGRALGDRQAMVAAIESAMQHIESEHARDEAQLAEIQARYSAFREQQSGMVGWLRRHIPFSATRREELQHRGESQGQQSELLANQMFLARAHLLREHLLDANQRQLGDTALVWSQTLASQCNLVQIQAYAASLVDLDQRLRAAEALIEATETQIENFSKAVFTAAQDKQAQQLDLDDAHAEVKAYRTEVKDKRKLHEEHLHAIGNLISDSLASENVDYDVARTTVRNLRAAREAWKESSAAMIGLREQLAEFLKLKDRLARIPDERQQVARSRRQTAETIEDEARHVAKLEATLKIHQAQLQSAEQTARHAKQQLAAVSAPAGPPSEILPPTQPLADAAQADRSLLAFAAQQADATLKAMEGPLHLANSQLQDAQNALNTHRTRAAELEKREKDLIREEAEVQQKLERTAATFQAGFRDFVPQIGRYLALLEPLLIVSKLHAVDWNRMARESLIGDGPGSIDRNQPILPPGWDPGLQGRPLEIFEHAVQAMKEDQSVIETEWSKHHPQARTLWLRHCERYLRDPLLKDVVDRFEG